MPDEIWTSPQGRTATLHPVVLPAPDDPEYEPWYAEFPGQRPPQAYELRSTLSGGVIESFVVNPVGGWSPYDAISDQLAREGWTPPPPTPEDLAQCEHGLSAQLCAGPGHYPQDM